MTDGSARAPHAIRRGLKVLLRPLRGVAGRFVMPTIDDRIASAEATLLARAAGEGATRAAALEDRVESLARAAAEGATRTTALEDRVESLARAALGEATRTAALEDRIEAVRGEARADAKADIAQAVGGLGTRLASDRQALRRGLVAEIDRTRSRLAVPDSEVIALEEFRSSAEYARVYEATEPLVSVTIATYDRAELLVERCLRSILDQDYPNLEIIVVGDGCTDDTEARVRAIGDDRITFAELRDRRVPAQVGRGAEALNLGRSMARGDLLTHLDDDDEYTPDRVGRLVRFLQETRAELVWHPFWWQEGTEAEWSINDADALEFAKVTSGAVLYLGWLKRVPWDPLARRYRAPGDWTLLRTMRDMGVRARRYPVPLLRHYLERQNPRLLEAARDDQGRSTATARRRKMPLVPDIASEAEYEAALQQVPPWVPAVVDIGARAGIRTRGRLRLATDGPYPALTTERGHVITLYGPWRGGVEAFSHDANALQLVGRVPGRLVPKLLAHGTLDGEWRYIVTTEVPGVPLATVRDELDPAAVQELARWLAGVVRGLHATPLSPEERKQGWDTFRRSVAQRHVRVRDMLAERGSLPGPLLSEVDTWMPDLPDLLSGEDAAVMLHGGLDAQSIVGVWRAGRFDPTGLAGLCKARIGHPYQELAALHAGVFQWDTTVLRAFLRDVAWPGTEGSDFARRAFAFMLLDAEDRLRGLDTLEGARDLDDLATRLFIPSDG